MLQAYLVVTKELTAEYSIWFFWEEWLPYHNSALIVASAGDSHIKIKIKLKWEREREVTSIRGEIFWSFSDLLSRIWRPMTKCNCVCFYYTTWELNNINIMSTHEYICKRTQRPIFSSSPPASGSFSFKHLFKNLIIIIICIFRYDEIFA